LAALKAVAAQLLALAIIGLALVLLGQPLRATLPTAAVQGALAAGLGALFGSERWWTAIHIGFAPALFLALRLDLPPWLSLAAFATLALVFWTTFRGEVPLFLSSRATAKAVLALLPRQSNLRVIDLGAGTAGLLRHLAQARPDARFVGVEHAPLPYLVARWNARGLANLAIERGDLWQRDLAGHDLVYAFLSPRVMPRLWRKARAEMRPGSLLVSSSFPVPDAVAREVVEVSDRRGTLLHCYRM